MTKGRAQDLFRQKAPGIMSDLMVAFALTVDDAAAILGNLGHECAGFTLMQEQKPTVKGSRGGYGWAQWTGPRRRAFEAHCEKYGIDPAGDAANLGFLLVELRGPEKKAIPALKAAKGLAAKVKAFELGFERAGVKHYASRNQWAAIALEAYRDAKGAAPAPKPAPAVPAAPQRPVSPSVALPGRVEPARPGKGLWASLLAVLGLAGAGAATQADVDQVVGLGIIVTLIVAFVLVVVLVRSLRK